jgi:uncharacterized membrane protein YidH (DUF202 family)
MKDDKNENSLMGGIMQIIVVVLLIGMIYAIYKEIKRIIIERDYTRLTIYIIVVHSIILLFLIKNQTI